MLYKVRFTLGDWSDDGHWMEDVHEMEEFVPPEQ